MKRVEICVERVIEESRNSVDFSPIEPAHHIYPHEKMNNAPCNVVTRRAEPVIVHSSGVRHVVRHDSVKSKTEQTTHDLIREHTEKQGTSVTRRVVHEKSPEVREIEVEAVKPHQGKPSGFKVQSNARAHNPLMPSRKHCEVVEITHVPVTCTNVLSGRKLNPLLKH